MWYGAAVLLHYRLAFPGRNRVKKRLIPGNFVNDHIKQPRLSQNCFRNTRHRNLMMKRSLLIIPAVLLINLLCGTVQAQEKCFQSEWLQQSHHITFKINGTSLTGRFIVSRDGEDTAYDFTGTAKANILTVKFAGGKIPDISPSEIRGAVWTIAPKGTEEILRIKVYGKNYTTNKYEVSSADYKSCTPSYPGLTAAAKPVAFTKGSTSAKMNLSFAANDEW